MSARSSHPDRRRPSRPATRTSRPKTRPTTRRPDGSFLNTLIVALLVVLALMVTALLLLVPRMLG